MVCRIINYFPPSLQSCVTEAKEQEQWKLYFETVPTLPQLPSSSAQDKGTRWSGLIWSLSPHFLREILRDSKSEMTLDSSDKLTFTCQMMKELPQSIP